MPDKLDHRIFGFYALQFRNQDPIAYEKFIHCMRLHVDELTLDVVRASPSDVLVAQGRAQAGLQMLQLMTEFYDDKGTAVKP